MAEPTTVTAWSRIEVKQLIDHCRAGKTVAEIAAAHNRNENHITNRIISEATKLYKMGTTREVLLTQFGFPESLVDQVIETANSQRTITLTRESVTALGGNYDVIVSQPISAILRALIVAFTPQPTPLSPLAQLTPSSQLAQPYPLAQPAHETTHTSSAIGQIGEAEVATALRGRFTVNLTAKIARSGDMIIQNNNRAILVEVKNYSGVVPQAEIDKFNRDIEAHGELHGGLFISLRSPIVGQTDRCKFVDGARPAILLQSSDSHFIVAMATLLDKIIADRLEVARSARALSTVSAERIAEHMRNISTSAGELAMSRTLLGELQNTLAAGCTRISTAILTAELGIANNIDALADSIRQSLESEPTPCEPTIRQAANAAIRKILPDCNALSSSAQAALLQIYNALPKATTLATTGSAIILRAPGCPTLEIATLKTCTNLTLTWPAGAVFTIPRWGKYENNSVKVKLDSAFAAKHLGEFVALCTPVSIAAAATADTTDIDLS